MGQILRNQNWRVITAGLFSVVIIVGAYWLARSPSNVAEASAETALLQAIATRDSDADGLPDWEESLYGTDSHITDTFSLGMTDGEAVARGLVVPKAIANISTASSSPMSLDEEGLPPAPKEGTLTALFAENFFTLFMAKKAENGGGDLTESQMSEVASQSLASLASIVAPAPDYKSAKDITVSGEGADTMKEYAVNAEAILAKNRPNTTTSEINYLKSALVDNDDTAYTHIASIAKAYRDTAVGLSALSAPKELAPAHLDLMNATMRVSGITSDFAKANTDPLATMLALQQYPKAVLDLGNAFIDIGKIYADSGISLGAGEQGASFVNLIADMNKKQATKP